MEILFRIGAFLLRIVGLLQYPFVLLQGGFRRRRVPPLQNDLLKIAAIDLAFKIRKREIKSEDVVKAYIDRIKEVNPYLNAVVEERFEEAIEDAKHADQICIMRSPSELSTAVPLLGVPFTVKESCCVKGLSLAVGNLKRVGIKATENGEAVENLRTAGAIPLLVSTNPEFCLSWECNNYVTGRSNNPYDFRLTSGGSSGGEGALNGAGASAFGIGSDLAGSIRMPCLFNGLFGHKPTGGLVPIKGHYPLPNDSHFSDYMQIGPMTRFARDLPILLHIMSGKNAEKLDFNMTVRTENIKIYYMDSVGFTLMHSDVQFDMKLCLLRAVEFFKRNGLFTQRAPIPNMHRSFEIAMAHLLTLNDMPKLLAKNPKNQENENLFLEFTKSLIGKSDYSFASLFFLLLCEMKHLFPEYRRREIIENEGAKFKKELMDLLGDRGVLFYPTFHQNSLRHGTSYVNLPAVTYCMIFNALGFPSTQVPMGLDSNGVPVGFQIVAAPYQDKLCLTIAAELEVAFGGWVSP